MSIPLGQHAEVDYKEGKLIVAVKVAAAAVPFLDDCIAKVESGEIDPIKGTDLDKAAMLQVLNALKAEALK